MTTQKATREKIKKILTYSDDIVSTEQIIQTKDFLWKFNKKWVKNTVERLEILFDLTFQKSYQQGYDEGKREAERILAKTLKGFGKKV